MYFPHFDIRDVAKEKKKSKEQFVQKIVFEEENFSSI